MDAFKSLQDELLTVKNLAALSRETGLSRDHLQRIRDGRVGNTTLRTMSVIREGILRLKSKNSVQPPERVPRKEKEAGCLP